MYYFIPLIGLFSVASGSVQQYASSNGRIVGGESVDIKKFPYQVAIEHEGRYICSGALISDSRVLTAAQCLKTPPSTLFVRVGSSLLLSGGTRFNVSSYDKHRDFDPKDFDYDVGIIHLTSKVTFSESVKAIRVGDATAEPPMKLTIAGWGETEDEGEAAEHLQAVEVSVFPWDKCRGIYNMFMMPVTERMMCTLTSDGKGTCLGDGGSPTVVNNTLVGVVSWGVGCGRPFYPDVHCNIAHPKVRFFIREKANV